MCHLSNRIGIVRLPGTRGSDPDKITSGFHQGNDCNLLHSPDGFIVKDLRESLPTINLSRGQSVSGWTLSLTSF